MDIIYSYNLHRLALTCLLLRMLMIHISAVFNQFVHFPRNCCCPLGNFRPIFPDISGISDFSEDIKVILRVLLKILKMAEQNDGGIFIISEKFEEIQSEIYQNHLTDSPITIANTNLAPQVRITRDPLTETGKNGRTGLRTG